MQDEKDILTGLCKELIEVTKQAKELDEKLRGLRFLVMLHMEELRVGEWEMPEAVVQSIPVTSHSGYSSKMIGNILPNVIDALIDAGRTDMVKDITKCYVTTHKSAHIRVKFNSEVANDG